MKGVLLRSTALTVLCVASPALAAEVEYVGPAIGNWTDGANWSTGSQPQAGDTVRVWHNDPVVPRTVIYDSVLNPALGHVTVQGSFGAPLTLQQEGGARFHLGRLMGAEALPCLLGHGVDTAAALREVGALWKRWCA